MAALDLSGIQQPSAPLIEPFQVEDDAISNATDASDSTDTDTTSTANTMNPVVRPMDVVESGTSIGVRIMRQFRRNSISASAADGVRADKSSNDVIKKKNMNSKAIEKLYLNKTLGRLKHTQLVILFNS